MNKNNIDQSKIEKIKDKVEGVKEAYDSLSPETKAKAKSLASGIFTMLIKWIKGTKKPNRAELTSYAAGVLALYSVTTTELQEQQFDQETVNKIEMLNEAFETNGDTLTLVGPMVVEEATMVGKKEVTE